MGNEIHANNIYFEVCSTLNTWYSVDTDFFS